VKSDWTIRYRNNISQLEATSSYPPAKSYVTVKGRLDGSLHSYYRTRELRYTFIKKALKSKKFDPQRILDHVWMEISNQTNQEIRI
jgi:hypothetical protein